MCSVSELGRLKPREARLTEQRNAHLRSLRRRRCPGVSAARVSSPGATAPGVHGRGASGVIENEVVIASVRVNIQWNN